MTQSPDRPAQTVNAVYPGVTDTDRLIFALDDGTELASEWRHSGVRCWNGRLCNCVN
jgi:hypothetical protein